MSHEFNEKGLVLEKFGFVLPYQQHDAQYRANREASNRDQKYDLFFQFLKDHPDKLTELVRRHIDPDFCFTLDPENDPAQFTEIVDALFSIRKPRFQVVPKARPDSLEEVLEYLVAARLVTCERISSAKAVLRGRRLQKKRRRRQNPHLTTLGVELEVSPTISKNLLDEDSTGELLSQYMSMMSQLQNFGPVLSYDGTVEIAFPPGLEGYEASATAIYELLRAQILEEESHNFHYTVGGIKNPHHFLPDLVVLQVIAELGGLFGQRPVVKNLHPKARLNMRPGSRKPTFENALQNVIDSSMIPFVRIKKGNLIELRAMSKNWPGFNNWTKHLATLNALTDALAATSKLENSYEYFLDNVPLTELSRVWKEVFESVVDYIDEFCRPASMSTYGGFKYFLNYLKDFMRLVMSKQKEFDLRFNAFRNPLLAQEHDEEFRKLLAYSTRFINQPHHLEQFLAHLEHANHKPETYRSIEHFRQTHSFLSETHSENLNDWLLDEYIQFSCETIEETITRFWAELVFFSQQPGVSQEISNWLTEYRSRVRSLMRSSTTPSSHPTSYAD